ncbi:hypothetical protein [Kribbella sp. NPDC004875]|uniref:hypothetical protein n=1 Tax=Kribbella sp. NPDC004875 TaxID=3364107 RepID=UPI0036B5DCF7
MYTSRVEVDGELFEVSVRENHPGTYDYDWVSGPNPGYGFSESSSPEQTRTEADHEQSIRAFLSGINPKTGYLD